MRRHQTRAKGVRIAGPRCRRDVSCGGAPRSRYLAMQARSAQRSLSTAGEPRMGESRTPTQDHHEAALNAYLHPSERIAAAGRRASG